MLHPRTARRIAGANGNSLHLSPSHLSVCLSVAEPASSPLCLMANQRSPSETGEPELHLLTYHPYCTLSFVWIRPTNHKWISQYSNLIECFVIIWYHFTKFSSRENFAIRNRKMFRECYTAWKFWDCQRVTWCSPQDWLKHWRLLTGNLYSIVLSQSINLNSKLFFTLQ